MKFGTEMRGSKASFKLDYTVARCRYPLICFFILTLGNAYQMKMRFVDHVFDDFIMDHFTLRIILPEGSKYV